MAVEFVNMMAERTDADLLEIAASSEEEYQAAALEAARAELARRNLTPERKQAAIEDNELKNTRERAQADTPLEVYWIILAFVFPGLLHLVFAARLRAQGRLRAAQELERFTLWAIGLYAAAIVGAIVVANLVIRILR